MKIDWTIYQVFQWIFELSTIIYSIFYCFNQYTFLIFRPPLFQSPSLKSKCPSVRNTISLGRFFITIFVFDLETAGLLKSRRLKIPETSEFLLDILNSCFALSNRHRSTASIKSLISLVNFTLTKYSHIFNTRKAGIIIFLAAYFDATSFTCEIF